MSSIYLKSFHVAGFTYYEGALVFQDLAIGSKLGLKHDANNTYDDNAVIVTFNNRKIGYVPKKHNADVAVILKSGHDIFESVVQQVSPDEHPEQQVRVAVFVRGKE